MSKAYLMVRDREVGNKSTLGTQDAFHKTLYSSMDNISKWDIRPEGKYYGGVFNLEFSPDCSVLVAACEKKTIVILDPLTLKEVKVVENAHTDCVNCVKFIDSHVFATGSDDTTIALWDTRNLRNRMRTLQGHSNWVKNIEYAANQELLVTSGFDGSIYTWDMTSFTEISYIYNRVFNTAGLMRCSVSPDASKLVICTTGGYLIVIHDLDLKFLSQDLEGFKPNILRLMQMGRQHIPVAANYAHLFCKSRTRNRVELVTDFPTGDDAEVISTLQIHPQGWCALSRNISYDESSEWTCVHDIQELETPTESEPVEAFQRDDTVDSDSDNEPILSRYYTVRVPAENEPRPANIRPSSDVWEAMLTIHDQYFHRLRPNRTSSNPTFIHRISGSTPNTNDPSSAVPPATPSGSRELLVRIPMMQKLDHDSPLYNNTPRLLGYIEEPNLGRGFIKELCFSSDGRVVCSPFGKGIRLLSFTEDCSELSNVQPELGNPQQLVEIGTRACHTDIVVSTKFSPRHCLLVSGCLNGEIVCHQPVL